MRNLRHNRSDESITRSAVGLLMAIALISAGCGVAFNTLPTVSLSPASISWHKVDVGNTSGTKVITVTNTSPKGALPLKISAIKLSSNFVESATTCPIAPSLLAPGASCTITVAFRPEASGSLTGKLSLVDNATDTPGFVSLNAIGGIGFLLFSPTSLSFPGVAANTTSQPQTATLTNEASTPVEILKISASSHYAEGDNCPIAPDTLAPGGSCSVAVMSTPTVSGPTSGAVNVEDSFGNVTQLYLSGSDQGRQHTGTISFSPSGLLWGKVAVGQTSAAKSITISNYGPSGVTFSEISTGRDFTIATSNCPVAPASLSAGASCSISVAFRPTISGSVSELLVFSGTTPGSSVGVSLKGTGSLGDLLFTPTELLFAGVNPGEVSASQSATLSNQTTGTVLLSSITMSGHFAQTNNCPATLAPQASCSFAVTSNPVGAGVITGSVNVKDGSGNSTQLYLKGQGGGVDQVLSFSPNPLAWGTVLVGQTSGSKTLTVANGQTVPLTIYSISIGQDFVEQGSTCPTAPMTVPAGSSCTLSLAFRPYSTGLKSEVITFTDDAPGGNQSVSLMGTGASGAVLFSPTSLSFAGVPPGTASQPQTATLTNIQSTTIALSSIALSGHFAQTNNCPASLAPQGACTFTVTSNPVIDGPIQGSVNVTDGSGTTTQLYLSGMGGIPINSAPQSNSAIEVTPSNMIFRSVMIGQTSGARQILVSNYSEHPVGLSSLNLGADLVEEGSNCPGAPDLLDPGSSCSIAVAFRPQTDGPKHESLSFNDSASHAQHVVAVTAAATDGPLRFVPEAVTFRSARPGIASAPQRITLTNQGTTAVGLRTIQAIGPFAQANDCPKSLKPADSCKITVVADFQVAGDIDGTVDVTDNTGVVIQLYIRMLNNSNEMTNGAGTRRQPTTSTRYSSGKH